MIYFDNSATTPLCESAKKKIISMTEIFGNPSSLHRLGLLAEKEISAARETVASTLDCRAHEIYFTSCGTEANNTAIIGVAMRRKNRGNKIITTDSEHPSAQKTFAFLEEQGFEIIRLKTVGGRLDTDELKKVCDDRVILLSIMHTNNETGAVYPVREAADIARSLSRNVAVHSDCVQAYMKEKLSPDALVADLISVSAHKIHAPKGVGALYVKKGFSLPPFMHGGEQERGLRPGTENTIGIAAFGAAAQEARGKQVFINSLGEYLFDTVSKLEFVKCNLPEKRAAHILNISLLGVRSEIMLHQLSREGVYVSSGSACSSKIKENRVLAAFGLDKQRADSAIRISLSYMNTKEETEKFADILTSSYNKLKRN